MLKCTKNTEKKIEIHKNEIFKTKDSKRLLTIKKKSNKEMHKK
jgi:hypothetical protein